MAHPLRKILYCSSESKKHLFAIVSREDDSEKVYTHVFVTAKKDQVWEETHTSSLTQSYTLF